MYMRETAAIIQDKYSKIPKPTDVCLGCPSVFFANFDIRTYITASRQTTWGKRLGCDSNLSWLPLVRISAYAVAIARWAYCILLTKATSYRAGKVIEPDSPKPK